MLMFYTLEEKRCTELWPNVLIVYFYFYFDNTLISGIPFLLYRVTHIVGGPQMMIRIIMTDQFYGLMTK